MISRRSILAASGLVLVPRVVLAACGKPTQPQTPGPFFKPSSPLRSSLLEKDSPRKDTLTVTGLVLGRDCQPLPGAVLDFWHADELGEYDNKGFRYRGHQRTDAQGRYRLETIVPAEYPGRARHIHVTLAAPGARPLTTQLYFPKSFGHHDDGLYSPSLEMKMPKRDEGLFDFVLIP